MDIERAMFEWISVFHEVGDGNCQYTLILWFVFLSLQCWNSKFKTIPWWYFCKIHIPQRSLDRLQSSLKLFWHLLSQILLQNYNVTVSNQIRFGNVFQFSFMTHSAHSDHNGWGQSRVIYNLFFFLLKKAYFNILK